MAYAHLRGDRSEALRELKALAEHANIAPAVGAHTTVAALLDHWFARSRVTWSPTTIRNLTSIVERHLKPGLGDILVGDLTAAIVDEFYSDLRSAGRMDGKPLAVGTVRRIHSALHAALAQAQRWSWVFENVADHATPPRDEPVAMRIVWLNIEVVLRLFERPGGDWRNLRHAAISLADASG